MRALSCLGATILLLACNGADPATGNSVAAAGRAPAQGASARAFTITPVATFDEPWAMTFLPLGDLLVTEKAGRLFLVRQDGRKEPVQGVPRVAYRGQGGLADVIVHPDYSSNGYIYLSYAEAGPNGTSGAAVGRGRLVSSTAAPTRIEGFQVIWRQEPKVTGSAHYGHRLAFSPDGHLFITSGERQKFAPAQDLNQTLGKIIRLTDAGGIPSDNPFYDQGRVKAQIWSYGHRNPLGIAFDAAGRLWIHEMGPKGGDELNLVVKGRNYGYPIVSDGDHYNGRPIPDHRTRPEFEAPKVTWTPVISPAGMILYSGDQFPQWRGDALIGGLSSEALVRVSFEEDGAREVERIPMGKRIREVEQGPDGAVWVLEDRAGGRLLKLAAAAR